MSALALLGNFDARGVTWSASLDVERREVIVEGDGARLVAGVRPDDAASVADALRLLGCRAARARVLAKVVAS